MPASKAENPHLNAVNRTKKLNTKAVDSRRYKYSKESKFIYKIFRSEKMIAKISESNDTSSSTESSVHIDSSDDHSETIKKSKVLKNKNKNNLNGIQTVDGKALFSLVDY